MHIISHRPSGRYDDDQDAPIEDREPTRAELAAIEAEWPLIEAELALLDEQIAVLNLTGHGSELHRRRIRRAERRVLAARRTLAVRDDAAGVAS
ncbi:DUF6284 family protein [Actinopolymorpha pittospori]|uniref:Uncharacterized protein n=1 Tax=Actinopolymorpha pittospori TaxID=648752 RepID=A0A927RHC4_9ACTN|nr:DUF6284 family protein [Actinopolymorpha pittospori]MBE1612060.1 hypothetical protein [Actinopolymorpha pittospori]